MGPCPAQSIWQGSGFAADQTNAMLAVVGTSSISLVSVAADDENSLTPLCLLFPPNPLTLGFGGISGFHDTAGWPFFRPGWAKEALVDNQFYTLGLRAHTAAHRGKHGGVLPSP